MPSAQSLNGASVADWLSKAGLQHHINSFQGVQPEVFRALLMQDYARYGITKLEDKQKLFRLVKSLQMKKTDFHSSEEANGSSAKAAEEKRSNGELLDLEAEDDAANTPSVHFAWSCSNSGNINTGNLDFIFGPDFSGSHGEFVGGESGMCFNFSKGIRNVGFAIWAGSLFRHQDSGPEKKSLAP